MNLHNLSSIEDPAEFLSGTQPLAFSVLSSPGARHKWVRKTFRSDSARDGKILARSRLVSLRRSVACDAQRRP